MLLYDESINKRKFALKYIHLLAKELGEVDWSTRSVKAWVTQLNRMFNVNFVVSRFGRLAVVFNACSKSTQERLLAADFGTDSAEDTYDFVSLVKTLGAVYNSVNHEWLHKMNWENR